MSEYSENDETMTEDEEVLADEVAEDEELDEDVIEDEADEDEEDAEDEDDEDEEDAEDEDDEPEAIDYNDTLFDKCQRAARLLRNRKDMIRDEESEKNERVSNLVRAVKLLELKPQMEQKEMAELLGVRLRELDAMMAEAEKNGIVSRVMPEEEDMRAILVSAEDGAAEAAAAQGREGVKLVPGLSDEELDEIFAVLDKIIDPLTKMGLDNDDRRGGFGGRGGDRGGRGGFDRGGRGGDRGGRGGFGGSRGGRDDRRGGDRGGRGGFDRGGDRGGRGGFGGRDDRGGRGGFGGRDSRGGDRGGFNRGGDRGGRGGFDRGGRGGYDRNDRGGYDRNDRGGFGGRDSRGGFNHGGDRGGRGGYGKRY